MSRVGKSPVPIPSGVDCALDGSTLKVKGPKGELSQTFRAEVGLEIADGEIRITRTSDRKQDRALHGLTRALVSNMVTGVSTGFQRTLLIEGVGYRANMQGEALNLILGYSHPVVMDPPAGVAFTVEGTQTIKVSGIDKQLVGQVASNVRAVRKPEPYKGKGVRYSDERIRRKVGKSGGK